MADSGNHESSDASGDETARESTEQQDGGESQPALLQHGFENYYDFLGVSPDAEVEEIESAYRAKTKEYHPDVSDKDNAAKLFALLQDAKEVLTSTKERSRYDQLGHWLYLVRRTQQDISIPDDVDPSPIIERDDPVVDLGDDEDDGDDEGDEDDDSESTGPKSPGEARARRKSRNRSSDTSRTRSSSRTSTTKPSDRTKSTSSANTGQQTTTSQQPAGHAQKSTTTSSDSSGGGSENVYKWAREATEALTENDRAFVEELWRQTWMRRVKAFVVGVVLLVAVAFGAQNAGVEIGLASTLPSTGALLSPEVFLPVLIVQAVALTVVTGFQADSQLGGGSADNPGPKPTRIFRDGLLLVTLGNAGAVFTGVTGDSSWFLTHALVSGESLTGVSVPGLSQMLPPIGVVAVVGVVPVVASVIGCFMLALGVSHRAWYDGYLTESSTTPYLWETPVVVATVMCLFGAAFATATMGYGVVELPAQLAMIAGGGSGGVPMAAGGMIGAVVAEVWSLVYLSVSAV